ncbi:MAG: hypothetical protein LBE84_08305 [Planctomycetota bacterium]|nr:hypothetical protein [Planctomycetota bacterium]
MSDESRRRVEIEAALKQIQTIQRRQARTRGRMWRLDISPAAMIIQGVMVFAIGVLVGLGASVLYQIVFP